MTIDNRKVVVSQHSIVIVSDDDNDKIVVIDKRPLEISLAPLDFGV